MLAKKTPQSTKTNSITGKGELQNRNYFKIELSIKKITTNRWKKELIRFLALSCRLSFSTYTRTLNQYFQFNVIIYYLLNNEMPLYRSDSSKQNGIITRANRNLFEYS